MLVLDAELTSKIKFIKEGEFVEKGGATALKLVGDVTPINQVDVTKRVKENLTKQFPLSFMELRDKVKEAFVHAKSNDVSRVIRENSLKTNPDYSAYNFRNKKQEDEYLDSGIVPPTTPSIYKYQAVDFIVQVLAAGG